MNTVTIQEAQSGLLDLIHGLMPGQVVTITENALPVAQIVPVPAVRTRPPRPRPPVTGIPRAGSVPGLVVPDNFKVCLEELGPKPAKR